MKALLAISPILPLPSDLQDYSHCLDFLKTDYKINWLDPLEKIDNLTYEDYETYWQNKISACIDDYDVFMGFSLGGVLIQRNLMEFLNKNKIIILISPPSIMTVTLKDKFTAVLKAFNQGNTIGALNLLYSYVSPRRNDSFNKLSKQELLTISKRMQFGLNYVVHHQLPAAVKACKVKFFQLIGENSGLVNRANVLMTPQSICQVVPSAGMRVFEDNDIFCQATIKEWLSGK